MSRYSACGFGDINSPLHRSMCIDCSRAHGDPIGPLWLTLLELAFLVGVITLAVILC